MTTLRQFDPLIIRDYITDVFLFGPHGHTYYEMIYIFKGKGTHLLNHNLMDYHAGELFLISPEDHHHFEVKISTRFIVIKFTEDYFNISAENGLQRKLIPLDIMRLQALKEVKLNFDSLSASALQKTILAIAACKDNINVATSQFVYYQLLSVFGLIRDSAIPSNNLLNRHKMDKQQLIAYIHENIYDPKKCRITHLAPLFNISVSYFGDHFKRKFGISLRGYVNQYRIKLIENRISSGTLSMKQIAAEFGFSDESHFSNYFKSQAKLSPAAYKKGSWQEKTIHVGDEDHSKL